MTHLGQFVENIGCCVDEQHLVRRELPATFEPGRPHLVVCAEHDTIPTLLSLYMTSPDQPLPTRSEVLLCHEETTKVDVELQLRRALLLGNKTGSLPLTFFSLLFTPRCSARLNLQSAQNKFTFRLFLLELVEFVNVLIWSMANIPIHKQLACIYKYQHLPSYSEKTKSRISKENKCNRASNITK